MKKSFSFRVFVTSLLFIAISSTFAQEEPIKIVQEEESAEVFLEEYTDKFQETFFEALKQKGIQNYDRASNLLLKCKQLRPEDAAIDHELAKVNFMDKQYVTAEQYAVEAVISKPSSYWYLNTLNQILIKQGNNFESVKNRIPYKNERLRYNLATINFKEKRFNAALDAIKGLKKTDSVAFLTGRIEDSIKKINEQVSNKVVEVSEEAEDPVQNLKSQLEALLAQSDFENLKEQTADAVEAYPLQPYFYYLHGLALNKNQKFSEAVETLQSGLDYLFDDAELAKKFYTEMVKAHEGLGEPSKANEYRNKLKSGL